MHRLIAIVLVFMAAITLSGCGQSLAYRAGTATPVASPTLQPSPTLAGSGAPAPATGHEVVRLDKVATWSEWSLPADVTAYRTEQRGHGGRQHSDFYPSRGVPSVSYIHRAIAPAETPWLWYGFGSLWECMNTANACEDYDWYTDAVDYAAARIDSGHSGLVIDWTSDDDPIVVANVANMTDDEIHDLIAIHFANMDNTAHVSAIRIDIRATSTAHAGAAGTGAPAPTGCTAARSTYVPQPGNPWNLSLSGYAVVNFWTNWPGHDQQERTLLLGPGDHSLNGGGTIYAYYGASCEDVARSEMLQNGLPQTTIEQLRNAGLAR